MNDPLLVAVVSGKGGVGKTMLSVAIANEMARGRRTLLVDLDFFNRGLTGLFASLVVRSSCEKLNAPEDLVRTVDDSAWVVAKVSERLFVLSYGDVDKASSTAIEEMNVDVVAQHLKAYVDYVCRAADCDFAVLDCHGGPDNTSFAACIIARYSILVSEPDKITLYGTLNFLRTLAGMIPERKLDIRLVFNKVIPAFGARFLFRFYHQFLAREFIPHDLLAIYPMEPHLTKAFERTPFLTTAYPTSQLAEKTRMLLYEMLAVDYPDVLPAAMRHRTRIGRYLRRYYLGRWPKLLDLDFIFRLTAISTIVLMAIPWLARMANERWPNAIFTKLVGLGDAKIGDTDIGVFAALVLFFWLVIAVGLKWARDLDVFLTYSIRTRSIGGALIGCAMLVALSLPWGVAFGELVKTLQPHTSAVDFWVGIPVIAFMPVPLLFYAKRGLRNIWYDRRLLEGGFRLVVALALPALGVLLAVLAH